MSKEDIGYICFLVFIVALVVALVSAILITDTEGSREARESAILGEVIDLQLIYESDGGLSGGSSPHPVISFLDGKDVPVNLTNYHRISVGDMVLYSCLHRSSTCRVYEINGVPIDN